MFVEKKLTSYYYSKIVKSLNHFEFTLARVKKLSTNPENLSETDFEIWDGFSTRFFRTADLFLSKYLKAAILHDDPAFDGYFRDLMNRAEKLKLVESVNDWIDIRGLRNVIVHEYSDDDLEKIFLKMLKYAPLLQDLRKRLSNDET